MSWAVDIEIALVQAFHWSLRDIDLTDVESLVPFVMRLKEKAPPGTPPQPSPTASGWRGRRGGMAFADEVSWL